MKPTTTSTDRPVRRALFVTLGVLLIGLGIAGVFLPGIPTTEFVIAASYLFARSSPRLEAWLEGNRWLGPSLRRFKETRGMPRHAKAIALASMWTGLSISIYALASAGLAAQLLAVSFGLVGTATILLWVRTTAARQSLILSSPGDRGGGRGPRPGSHTGAISAWTTATSGFLSKASRSRCSRRRLRVWCST